MELIQIKEKIKILELCNDQGFLTDKDKTLLTELTYVVEQLSLHLVSKSFTEEQMSDAYNSGYSDGLKDGLM